MPPFSEVSFYVSIYNARNRNVLKLSLVCNKCSINSNKLSYKQSEWTHKRKGDSMLSNKVFLGKEKVLYTCYSSGQEGITRINENNIAPPWTKDGLKLFLCDLIPSRPPQWESNPRFSLSQDSTHIFSKLRIFSYLTF